MKQYINCSLKPYHTFGMEVTAYRLVEYETIEELRDLLHRIRTEWSGKPWLHIGGGSNLLFIGNFFPGVVLHSSLSDMDVIQEDEHEVFLRVGSGMVWDDLVAYSVARGWGGMENLSAIPGEVGASAVQNIGAYGREVKDLIVSVETLAVATGEVCRFSCEDCKYGYRSSIFKNQLRGQHIVTHVTYRLQKKPTFYLDYGNIRTELADQPVTLKSVRNAVMSIRQAKLPDPAEFGNAGSFFVNPVVDRCVFERIYAEYPGMPYYEVDESHVKIPAGWLIEQSGWKGRSLGRAAVHDKQALVLINTGNATGGEVMTLARTIQRKIRECFGIEIQPEVNVVQCYTTDFDVNINVNFGE